MDDLPESRLYTAIDAERRYALAFVEGQRLVRDLALIHGLTGPSFAWFRDAVLSIQPLISLIKRGEQLGFYVDSRSPTFRLKIETGHSGDVRCTLWPEDLEEVPERIHGLVRLYTLFPDRAPYESIVRSDGLELRELVNLVLRDSHQIAATVRLSPTSDQSAMLQQLPALRGEDPAAFGPEAQARRMAELAPGLSSVFERALTDPSELAGALGELGFRVIADRPVRFRCGCSRQRMVENLRLVRDQGLFEEGDTELEIVCEYCKTRYAITRAEVEQEPRDLH